MKTSDSLVKIAPALLKAQKAITHAKKDATNPHFKSRYADFSAVLEAVKEHLNSSDVFFSQTPSPSEDGRLHLTTRMLHVSGEWMEDTAVCPLPKADPQGFGSTLTYLKRYSLAAFMALPTEDDDGEAGSHGQALQPAKNTVPEQLRPYAAIQSAPATKAPISVPREPLDPAGAGWRQVIVPKFIKKWAGATLGEMDEQDLLYWAKAYTPKEYPVGSGKISQKDLDFRAALDAAQAELVQAPEQLDGDPSPF